MIESYIPIGQTHITLPGGEYRVTGDERGIRIEGAEYAVTIPWENVTTANRYFGWMNLATMERGQPHIYIDPDDIEIDEDASTSEPTPTPSE